MDLITCGKCGRIHERSFRCTPDRIYKKTDAEKRRSGRRWYNKANQIKEDAHGLCELCKAEGVFNYKDIEVHHIIKVNEDDNEIFEDDNLICLCRYHHRKADKGEYKIEYLQNIARERRNNADND